MLLFKVVKQQQQLFSNKNHDWAKPNNYFPKGNHDFPYLFHGKRYRNNCCASFVLRNKTTATMQTSKKT